MIDSKPGHFGFDYCSDRRGPRPMMDRRLRCGCGFCSPCHPDSAMHSRDESRAGRHRAGVDIAGPGRADAAARDRVRDGEKGCCLISGLSSARSWRRRSWGSPASVCSQRCGSRIKRRSGRSKPRAHWRLAIAPTGTSSRIPKACGVSRIWRARPTPPTPRRNLHRINQRARRRRPPLRRPRSRPPTIIRPKALPRPPM